MVIERLDDLLEIKHDSTMVLSVIQAGDQETLIAVLEAEKLGLVEPVLIGDAKEIEAILKSLDKKPEDYKIINELDLEKSAEIGMMLVRDGEADFVMKGKIDTGTVLNAALDREKGIRGAALLSHIMAYDVDNYHKLIFITDGAMSVKPTVGQKSYIIENAIEALKALGRENIKVACLAAKEKVDETMEATIDAVDLKDIFEDNKDAIVDGPMAFDLAISKKAKEIKDFHSEVAGDADILLVPNIEMGNGIGKAISHFANGKGAGVVMGARAPIILTSRSDSNETKLYSIALGSLISRNL